MRRERQMEGIAAAKACGVYTGSKPRTDPATAAAARGTEAPAGRHSQVARHRSASVYRVLGKKQAA